MLTLTVAKELNVCSFILWPPPWQKFKRLKIDASSCVLPHIFAIDRLEEKMCILCMFLPTLIFYRGVGVWC